MAFLGLDRRNLPRAIGIAVVLGLIVASFLVRGELHWQRDPAQGAIYPVMSDAGVAYVALVPALMHWVKFLLFGLLFLLAKGWRSEP